MLNSTDIAHRSLVFVDSSEEAHKFSISQGNLVLENSQGEVLTRLNKQKVLAIFIIGRISLTSVMIDYCQKNAISLVLLNTNLRLTGFWSNSAEANYLLRQRQYLINNDSSLNIAKQIIYNKIINQKETLSLIRNKNEFVINARENCSKFAEQIFSAGDLQSLMGIEGNAAKVYFKAIFSEQDWQGRKPRTKTDPMNVVLDIGYTFLFNYVECFVRLFGFDLYKGNLHQTWFRRKSLICDLVEPFRVLIDYQVRKSFNLGIFQANHFTKTKHQYHINPKYIKTYSRVFFEVLVFHKEDIFIFVRDYYRCFMREKDITSYPLFKIKEN